MSLSISPSKNSSDQASSKSLALSPLGNSVNVDTVQGHENVTCNILWSVSYNLSCKLANADGLSGGVEGKILAGGSQYVGFSFLAKSKRDSIEYPCFFGGCGGGLFSFGYSDTGV